MDNQTEKFRLPSFVALLITQRDGLTATFEAMLEVIKDAEDLSASDLDFWKAQFDAMRSSITIINNALAKYSEDLKAENSAKKIQPVETVAELFAPKTASNCYLNYLDHKCLLFLAQEIIEMLDGENNLTESEKEYWLHRLKNYNEMSRTSLEMVKHEVEFHEREQAINALVPFVNKAHLN